MSKPEKASAISGPVLETHELTVRFGGHVAVNAVSCAFHAGTLTAIVGPNGAGKTTFFNLISGQIPATDGEVRLFGQNISRLSVPQRTNKGIGRAFQLTNLFPYLSVHENVRIALQARAGTGFNLISLWTANRELLRRTDEILQEVGLIDRRFMQARALSHGDQRKLEIALLLALEPEVYMFDEPTAGMSVDDMPAILNLIRKIKQRGKTVLLVEHKMNVVRELADRLIVLHNGTLVADGDPATVIASPVVQEAYLGVAPKQAAKEAQA